MPLVSVVLACCGSSSCGPSFESTAPELEGSPRARFIVEDPQALLDTAVLQRARSTLRGGSGATALRGGSGETAEAGVEDPAASDELSRPWKVDLGHDVRNVLLALPGRKIERVLEVEAGQSLRLAWGAEAPVRRPLTFRVLVRPDRGKAAELFAAELGPDQAGVWHQARLGLDRYAGRRLLLTLETAGDESIEPGLAFWAAPEVVSPAREPPPSLLLISIDTLRADRLSAYGYPRPTSPKLDAWASRRAVLFRRVVAPSPWTLPSHISIFTGLDAFRHGFNHDVGGAARDTGAVANAALEMLAETLRRAGYATAAFTGGAYMHPKYGFAQGFDRYQYWPDRARAQRELEVGVERALSWMEAERGTPFFCLLHTYAVHDPYVARQPYFDRLAPPGVAAPEGEIALESPPNDPARGFRQRNRLVLRSAGGKRLLGESDRPLIDAMYDSGVAYADAWIGRLLDGLEALGLADRTVVVVTSDHGEALGEAGRAGHVDLYDHTLLVPLMLALPGGRGAGRVVDRQVRSIDVAPTVLEALGLEPPAGIDGVSLLPLVDGRPSAMPYEAWSYSAAASYGLALRIGDRLEYIFNNSAWPPFGGEEELYDLRQDGSELRNLAPGDPRLAMLRKRMREVWDQRAAGLRLRVSNAAEGILRGDLKGAMVRSVGTKSLDFAHRFVNWKEMGWASFELAAGESFTLHFEKVFGREIELSGELDAGGLRIPYSARLAANDPAVASRWSFDGVAWGTAGGGPVKTGFELWWSGRELLAGESPAASDPDLRRQLEALGYVQ